MPSATDCSRPNLPARLGPTRFCIRPMSLRSTQTPNSTLSIRKTKMTTALMMLIHQRILAEVGSVGSAARTVCSVMRRSRS